MDLTCNSTAFWAAYLNYETQYAAQLHIRLLGPLLAAANASLQNTQIETLVTEGAKAIIVNPETATSLGPAISYAAAHHVQLVSVDTIVGVGKVYMVVRASNTNYGLDACAYISSKVKSGYVLDLEGDLTSSNGADRTNAFNQCMAANDPSVHILKDPTVWTEATAVTDAQNAVNAYGGQLKAIYAQWSSPDTGILPLVTAMVGERKKDHHPERPVVSPLRPGAPPAAGPKTPDLVVSSVSLASTGVFLSDVSLTVRGGEPVGITGLRGSGATALARIVAGAAAPDTGEVRLCFPGGPNRVLRPGDRAGALRAGVGYIPEDRLSPPTDQRAGARRSGPPGSRSRRLPRTSSARRRSAGACGRSR